MFPVYVSRECVMKIDRKRWKMTEDVPEVEIGYTDIGCYFRCPKCGLLCIFTNVLPDEIEKCQKCGQKVRSKFGGLCND